MPRCYYYYYYYFVANRNVSLLLLLLILTYYYRWVTFIVGLICFVLLQVIWCCRQSKIGLYISAGLSTLAGITCTIAGIVMLVVWKDQVQCSVWRLTGGGNWWSYDYYSEFEKPDYCEEGRWAVVAFVSALLWFTTSGCILYFVKSGRHTKWEHKLQAAAADADIDTDTTTAIEMGTVVQHYHHHDDDHHQQQSPIALATTSAATTAVATAVVLPDIPNKIDNV